METRRSVLALVTVLVLTRGAFADDAKLAAPEPRQRVRIKTSGTDSRTIIGYFTANNGTSITLTQKGRRVQVPLSAVTSIDVSVGRERHFWKGGIGGTVLGGLIAANWGFYKPDPGRECTSQMFPDFQCTTNPTRAKIVTTLVFTVGGAFLQAGRQVDRWAGASLDQLKEAGANASVERDSAIGPTAPKAPLATPGSAPLRPIASQYLGSRVRFVLANGKKVTGELSFLSSEEARLLSLEGAETRINRATISKTEESTGRKRRWASGLAVGAIAGLAIGLSVNDTCTEMTASGLKPCSSRAEQVASSSAAMAAFGGMVGFALHKESFRPLSLESHPESQGPGPAPHASLQVAPILRMSDRSAGLSFRVSW